MKLNVYHNPHFKKGKGKTIFTINGIVGLDLKTGGHDNVRTFGWYADAKDAIKAVLDNKGDLCESYYEHIIIEELKEGAWAMSITEWWFKWDYKEERFYSIPKPKATMGTINWSM